MPQLRSPVRREAERDAGQERRIVTSREIAGQQEDREGGERPGQKEREVVGSERIASEPVDRAGDHADADEILGERTDPVARVEIRRVPPGVGERHRGGVPPQDRGVQDRVVGIVGDVGRALLEQRAGVDRGDHQIQGQHRNDAPGARARGDRGDRSDRGIRHRLGSWSRLRRARARMAKSSRSIPAPSRTRLRRDSRR